MSIKKTKTYEVLVEEGAPFIAGFTRALMGYSDYNGSIVSVYDLDKCIDIFAEDMPYEEAIDSFYLHIHAVKLPHGNPIFVRLDKNI
jgi:hypothetical protein